MRSGAGEYTERVVILSRVLASADATGEEVESWPTPQPVGTAEHWCKIEGSGGNETTDATRGSYRSLSVRFRHLVTLAAVDKIRLRETGQVFRVTGCWRERDDKNRGWRTVATLSAIGEIDATAPTLASATVSADGVTLTLVFSEEVTGSTGFTLSATGGAVTATYSSGDGSGTDVFTLSRTITSNETVTISYSPGTVEDWAGNALAAFSGTVVANGSAQSSGPTLVSATIPAGGLSLVLVFSQGVDAGDVDDATGAANGIVIHATDGDLIGSSGDLTTVNNVNQTTLTFDGNVRPFVAGEIVTLDYSHQSNVNESIRSHTGQVELADLSGFTVTNNA